MGSLVSTTGRTNSPISSKGNGKARKFECRRGSAPQLNKRSSIHRPVLQLQVKPDTLERVRHRTGSNGSVMVSRSTLRTLAAGDSAAYENLFLRQRQSIASNSSRSSSNHVHHSRHFSTGSQGSLESMVLLQIMEDDKHILVTEADESDYDHLLPKGEFSHLCACTYGPMQEAGLGGEMRRRGHSDATDHMAAIHYGKSSQGRPGSVLLTAGLSPEELKERIRQHQSPARDGSFRRSKSVSALASYQPTSTGEDSGLSRLQHSTSTSLLDDERESDWTLGESIIKTLSRRDMLVIDVDNPQSQSERAIVEAWPRLKEKLKKLQHRSSEAVADGWV